MTLHRRGHKVLEKLKGTGQVLKKGKPIAKVSYDLYIEMDEVSARSFDMVNETSFRYKSVTGKIFVLEGALPRRSSPVTPSGSFTLVLQDGRKTDFYAYNCASKPNATQREYEIQGTGHKL
jgi:hypothetical protein